MQKKMWLSLSFAFCVSFILNGCLSTGIKSTGAVLPQASLEFGGKAVHVSVSHNCSGWRCTGFDATFENLLDETLEVNVAKSKLTRAGISMPLALAAGKNKETIITIPPHAAISASFLVMSADLKTPMSYVRSEAVWCSLKVDPKCTKVERQEARCAGFARYYYDKYMTTGGWIKVSFKVKGKEWPSDELYESIIPEFAGNKPAVQLEPTSDAPLWFSGSGTTVFYKIECNDKCVCKDVEKARNSEIDERFEPIEK